MLTARLPALGRAAGLRGVRYQAGGQTALTGDAINSTASDVWRVGLAIVAVTLLLLIVFLRALLAPVYLLAASLLAVLPTLGLTVVICRALFGSADLVYFVPFAAGVLLVSLGSGYNVFVVGRIWEEARRRPARDAVAVARPPRLPRDHHRRGRARGQLRAARADPACAAQAAGDLHGGRRRAAGDDEAAVYGPESPEVRSR